MRIQIPSYNPYVNKYTITHSKKNKTSSYTVNTIVTDQEKNYMFQNERVNVEISKISKEKEFLKNLNTEYWAKYIKLCEKYKDTNQKQFAIECLKLVMDYDRQKIKYAQKEKISFFQSECSCIEDIKTASNEIEKFINLNKKYNKDTPAIFNANYNVSFSSKKAKIINQLTKEQKIECNFYIHSHSLLCGGISAIYGELCALGLDIGPLIALEAHMFYNLTKTLNADPHSAIVHGLTHMLNAANAGGHIVKTIASWAVSAGHLAAIPTTGGTACPHISAGLRAVNGLISSTLCESMGWAFVKDYQTGQMNINQKTKEAGAAIIFQALSNFINVDNILQLLNNESAKKLALSIYKNSPQNLNIFLQGAQNIIHSNSMTYAAQGLSIIVPALGKTLIENGGKISSDNFENLIKNSIFSIVTSNVIGNCIDVNNKQEMKKYVEILSNDPKIKEMLHAEFVKLGIKSGMTKFLNKNTINGIEDLYNNLCPKIIDIAQTMKGI